MSFRFNPFTANFDDIGNQGVVYWNPPVNTTGDLPLTDLDGSARVVKADDKVYIFNLATTKWTDTGLTPAAFGSAPNANGLSLSTSTTGDIISRTLILQPADSTNPGAVSTAAQSFGGDKTFDNDVVIQQTLSVTGEGFFSDNVIVSNAIEVGATAIISGITYANGGVDVIPTGGTDALNLGTSDADVINIGHSGATVNIQGTTLFQDVTNLEVTDKNITVNKGGSVASGTASGVAIEEDGVITGYNQTSGDRNSWSLKAPNTAGIATITPGAGGITLNQSSHDPVTLNAVGAVPNANGASLSSQSLTLQPANATNPGVVTAGAQTLGGVKTFDVAPAVAPFTTAGVVHNNASGVLSSSLIVNADVDAAAAIARSKLASGTLNHVVINDGSGVLSSEAQLAISRGGTATNTVPANGQLLIGNGTAYTVANLTAGAGITITNGAGTISIAESVPSSTGDITQTSFSGANNQVAPANVTGLAFNNAVVRSFEALVSVTVDATADLYEGFRLHGIQRGSDWQMSQTSTGTDNTQVIFTINSSGQVQYVSGNYAGFSSLTIKFRAQVLGV